MRNWTADDLHTIGATAEVDVAPLRPDGSLRPSTPIWIVRVGDDLYVRSYRGPRGSWFRHALQRHERRIRTGALQRDVIFEEPDDADDRAIDEAYRSTYGRSGGGYADTMVSPNARAVTLRLVPR